jgi:predicted  nucleic acid-binding Zn-ribbon protein
MFFATGLPGWMRAGANAAPASDVVTEAKKQALRNQVATLQSELDLINKRLSETETKTAAD